MSTAFQLYFDSNYLIIRTLQLWDPTFGQELQFWDQVKMVQTFWLHFRICASFLANANNKMLFGKLLMVWASAWTTSLWFQIPYQTWLSKLFIIHYYSVVGRTAILRLSGNDANIGSTFKSAQSFWQMLTIRCCLLNWKLKKIKSEQCFWHMLTLICYSVHYFWSEPLAAWTSSLWFQLPHQPNYLKWYTSMILIQTLHIFCLMF